MSAQTKGPLDSVGCSTPHDLLIRCSLSNLQFPAIALTWCGLTSHRHRSIEPFFMSLAARDSEFRRWSGRVDRRICQTFAASPAEPGGLPLGVRVASYRDRTMLGGADASFEAYRQKHASRDPDLANMRFADELRQLTTAEGLNELASPPYAPAKTGNPPRRAREAESTKYLWVVAPTTVPFALESLPEVRLQRGRLSHTNLTGGGPAHSGGEMRLTEASIIVMNGGSG